MLKYSSRQAWLSAAVLLCAMTVSPFVIAKCGCPADGHGAPQLGGSGLGESFPVIADVAPDPSWQVYEFERDGVRYVQVNDSTGRVRAAVGRIEDTLWVLPIGSDADRVSITEAALPSGYSKLVYRSNDLEVVLVNSGNQDRWIVRQPAAGQ